MPMRTFDECCYVREFIFSRFISKYPKQISFGSMKLSWKLLAWFYPGLR